MSRFGENGRDGSAGRACARPRRLRLLELPALASGIGVVRGVQSPLTQAQSGGKQGGTLTVLDHEDFENLDPGVAYGALDYEVLHVVQRPLYSNKPNTLSSPIPDIASGPPEISSDAKTVTVHIRHGRPLQPPGEPRSDLRRRRLRDRARRQPERQRTPTSTPTSARSRAPKRPKADRFRASPRRIAETIVFHLSEPKAQILVDALVLPLTAPVPEEYAKPFDAKKPSEYGNYQVATGPYMFKADAAGKILGVGYQPGKSATLVRNPNWNASTDFSPAYLDQININIGGDPNVIGRQVLEGSDMVQNDTPAQPIVKLAYQQFRATARDLAGRRRSLRRRR